MKVLLKKLGVPDDDGLVFPVEVIQEALDCVEENDARLLVTLGGGMKMADVCGQVVSVTLSDDELSAEVEFIDTEAGKLCKQMALIGSVPRFSMAGHMSAGPGGVVTSLTFLGVNASFEGQG